MIATEEPSAPPLPRRRASAAKILILLGVLLLAAALILLTLPEHGKVVPPVVGKPMPDLNLTGLDGRPVNLSDYKGKPVLINAWATWCPPCRAEMPDLQALYETYRTSGFTVLALNAGEPQPQVRDFVTQNGFTFPILLDPNSATLDALGIFDFPTSIFVGPDGLVKIIHIGLYTPQALQMEIVPLLKQE